MSVAHPDRTPNQPDLSAQEKGWQATVLQCLALIEAGQAVDRKTLEGPAWALVRAEFLREGTRKNTAPLRGALELGLTALLDPSQRNSEAAKSALVWLKRLAGEEVRAGPDVELDRSDENDAEIARVVGIARARHSGDRAQ